MIELIPAIDIIEGKCVRLSQGDYGTRKVYGEDPAEMALRLEDVGIHRLHVVDLDGAKAGHIVNYRTLERIATRTNLCIDFGGGVKRDEDLRIAFESGAQMVTGGSVAVREPERFLSWLKQYGSERIILGADAKDRKIAVGGWEESTALELVSFIQEYVQQGVRKTICTDIGKDGMLQGPAVDLYQDIQREVPEVYLIASGGVSSIADIERLAEAGISAVIFGKALYEGRISFQELERLMRN